MKGLLRNNLFAVYANAKVFSVFLLLWGIFVAAVPSQSLQIGYGLTGIIGFPVNAIAVVKSEYASKWGKYKLTLPVKRMDIIKSLFLNQIIWLFVGVLFAGAGVSLSWLLHGCVFDQPVDALTMIALGVSISLFMGAIFFPLFYLGGEERGEVFLVISILCAFGIDLLLVNVLNELLEPGIAAVLIGAAALVACSLAAFVASYWVTAGIFRKKEY